MTCGEMWKKFVIFALLQLTVMNGEKQLAAATSTDLKPASTATTTKPTTTVPPPPTTTTTTIPTTIPPTTHKPIDGKWSNYTTTKWSECSLTCGNGTQTGTRYRTCIEPQFGGKACHGLSNDTLTKPCNLTHCPVDGKWSNYTTAKWSKCSVTCGNGTLTGTRTRTCMKPQFGGKACTGLSNDTLTKPCNLTHCPVNGNWSNYKIKWNNCSKACGAGNQTGQRTRTCTNPKPQFEGENCIGPSNESIQRSCYQRKCPDPPEDITNQTQTSSSVSLYIIPANINYTSFLVCVNSAKSETNRTNYTVNNLAAAKCYNISVLTKFHDVVSSQAISRSFCTVPPAPTSVYISDLSSTSITISVVHGLQSKYSLDVYINGNLSLSQETRKTFASTNIKIDHLQPGAAYYNITVFANYKGLRSRGVATLRKQCVLPPVQPLVYISSQTNKSMSFHITHGEGLADSYNIYLNGINRTYSADVNSSFTIAVFGGLNPGTLYKDIKIQAQSHGAHSPLTDPIQHATNPSRPIVSSISRNTTSLMFSLKPGSGSIDKFKIYLNGKYFEFEPQNHDKIVAVISGLDAGTLYLNISIKAVFHNLNSSDTFPQDQATIPSRPIVSSITQNTTSLVFSLKPGPGSMDSYEVYVNQTAYDFPTRSNEPTVAVISGLHAGTLYKNISVKAVSHNLKSSGIYLDQATVPSRPIVSSITQNTTSLVFSLKPGPGSMDSYEVYINHTAYEFPTRSHAPTVAVISGLHAGTLYKNISVKAVYHNLKSSGIYLDQATVPSRPIVSSITQNSSSLVFSLKPGPGSMDSYEIYINQTAYEYPTHSHEPTVAVISGLHAGTLYKNISVKAVSHALKSSGIYLDQATVPSRPIVSSITQNTTSLVFSLKPGPGSMDSYEVYINHTAYEFPTRSHAPAVAVISGLHAGTLYKNISVKAVSHNLKSSGIYLDQATEPDTPYLEIDESSITTSQISGLIHLPNGAADTLNLTSEEEKLLTYTLSGSKFVIFDLNPGEIYHLWAIAVFDKLTSGKENTLAVCTVPSPPTFIINNQSTTTMSGSISQAIGGKDTFSISCNGTNLNYMIKESSHVISNLTPGTMYSCQATTTFCNHTSEKTSLKKCTVPSPPTFTINNQSTTTMSGSISQAIGGKDTFSISCNGTNLNYRIKESSHVISNLIPGTMYSCQATTTFCNHTSETTSLKKCTVPSIPKSVTVRKSSNETMDLDINKGNGGVENYIVSFQPVSKAKCAGKLVKRNGKNTMKIDSLSAGTIYNISIISVFNKKHSSPYLMQHATDPSPPVDVRIKDKKKDSVTIEIVKGKGCVKRFVVSIDGLKHNVTASTDKDVTVYSIRGLDSATFYPIKVYAVSNGAYNLEMSSMQISLTTENDPVPVAIGIVVGVLAALIVILTVFSWRRQALCFKKNIPKEVVQGNMNSGFEEEVELADTRRKRPVKLSDFHRHVEMMSRNTHMKFSEEFKELGILSPKHSTDISQIQENRPKNRYTNILPFDHSIVKLIGVEDEIGSDFINANYIPGKKSKREFIATQGPLPSTKEEMWRMIWEQNVSIVVMLTQLIERGRKKCEIYWPENTNEKMFLGEIIVEVVTISHLPNYTLRTITLQLGDVERRIKHYNYLAWPDMGTPKTTDIMINFVDTVRKEVKPNMKGPIVVHCSAGVGRTGTFIMMDILLQEIRSKCTEVDIFGMILNMRNYRLNMVQTEDQYIFIHNCVKDLIDVSDDEEEEDGVEEQHEPIYQNC